MVGEKRSLSDTEEEEFEIRQKRVKMRDLKSVLGSEEKLEHSHSFVGNGKPDGSDGTATITIYSDGAEAEVAEGVTLPIRLNSGPTPVDLSTKNYVANSLAASDKSAEVTGDVRLPPLLDFAPGPVDLNPKSRVANTSGVCNKPASGRKSLVQKHDSHQHAKSGFGWDLNTEDVSSSLNPFHPYKKTYEHLKPSDALECASTTGPLEEKDPMKIWKEMKQNGFISTNHGGVPPPKPRARKRSDGIKKKMEIAKREQVDRFAKVAAPSGLLNELNPGIINHVRNRKQVHSIIEALVRSGKDENRRAAAKQSTPMSCGAKEVDETRNDMRNGLGMYRFGLSDDHGSLSTLSQNPEKKDGNTSTIMKRGSGKDRENHILELKLASSVTMVSDNISSVSNEDSANLSSVSSLSVKAANIASQWLELLCQDINGRLAALRCSKKRVHAVIHTDLPFLMSKEFSSNQENDECPENVLEADAHRARWSALFDQMENALSEEEKQLECWLSQVKGMQLHCERGLQYYGYSGFHDPQWMGPVKPDSRSEEADSAERELAVRAAAASIYSTCNFLLSSENIPSC